LDNLDDKEDICAVLAKEFSTPTDMKAPAA
jgi:hypothetical protein